jgi:high-affinity nickel-transport protein
VKRALARLNHQHDHLPFRIAALYLFLLVANLGSWIWALVAFHNHPALLGMAAIAYGFGLRHAVDADHIAAIDNVTRSLMQAGKRPAGVGFFFALGHSTIVILATAAIAVAETRMKTQLAHFHTIGTLLGTSVSALFMLAIAATNMALLPSLYRAFRRGRRGVSAPIDHVAALPAESGILSRLLRPLVRLIAHSWQMYPLGVLFGLGFDTATEIGLLGLSASQSAQGVPVASILVFPALFTSGMSLIDTTDGLMMLGAYGWAFIEPGRKITYNLAITLLSVLVAIAVGGIESVGLIRDHFHLNARFWAVVDGLNDHFGTIGYLIIGVFAASWAASWGIDRRQRRVATAASIANY